MAFTLPPLPYGKDALAPTISPETIDYHYGKHHQAYVNNLNNLVPGTKYEKMTLDEVVKASNGQASEKKVFNNSAQVWNHTFYWNCLAPKAGGDPTGNIKGAIDKAFGNFADFKKKFNEAAAAQFGSGWAWLVKTSDGGLAIAFLILVVPDPLAGDARAGRVEHREGAIGKRRVGNGRARSSYFLVVGDRRFRVARSTYEAAPDAGYVRIYYLPRSRKLVNL